MSESTSILLNGLLMSITGAGLNFLAMYLIFHLRHRPLVWWCYFIARAVIDGLFNVYFLSGKQSAAATAVYMIFIISTAVITYFVQYYTWDTDLLKVGIGALLSDMLAAFCVVAGVAAVNLICGRDAGASYQTAWRPDSIPMALACLGFFALVAAPWHFLMRRFKDWHPAHARIYLVIMIVLIAIFTGTQFTDLQDITVTAVLLLFSVGIIIAAVLLSVRDRLNRERQLKAWMELQKDMIRDYSRVVTAQIAEVKQNQEILRTYEARVRELGEDHSDEKAAFPMSGKETPGQEEGLLYQIERLKKEYEILQKGQYNGNVALDSILTSYAEALEKKRVQTDFSASEYHGNDMEAILLCMNLLHWVEETWEPEIKQKLSKNKKQSEKDRQLQVGFRIFEEKNQGMIQMILSPAGPGRFPGISGLGQKDRFTVVTKKTENGQEILIMFGKEEV